MVLNDGWVVIPRDILNHPWADDCGTMALYIRMIFLANIADSEWHGITVKRGSFVSSRNRLAHETGLSEQQVRTCVSRLEATNKITKSAYSKFTVYTVIDYDKMQNPTSRLTNKQPTDNQQATNKQPHNKQDKQENELNNIPPLPPKGDKPEFEKSFARFWAAYPKKTAKSDALKAWKKLAPNDELVVIILCNLEKQKKSSQWCRDNGQFIPYPATWLNGRRWEDEAEQPHKQADYDYGDNPFGWG